MRQHVFTGMKLALASSNEIPSLWLALGYRVDQNNTQVSTQCGRSDGLVLAASGVC